MKPIRVLHLRDSPWVDGPARTILETAARIDRSRIDYHVGVLASDPDGKHELVDALNARGVPVHALKDRPGIDATVIADIVRLMHELADRRTSKQRVPLQHPRAHGAAQAAREAGFNGARLDRQ